jgi:adenine-specific DNA-methyltransferase
MVSEPPPRYGDMAYDDAWYWFSKSYPAVAAHLLPFKEKAIQRTDQGDFWWELRACDYYDEFEKPKIVYPNICKQPEFTLVEDGAYTNQKCFIITHYTYTLLAILNSRLCNFLFKSILPKLRGDFYEPSYAYFKNFPIVETREEALEDTVYEILVSKKRDSQLDTTVLESKIDLMVYHLYGLTYEEVKVIDPDFGLSAEEYSGVGV